MDALLVIALGFVALLGMAYLWVALYEWASKALKPILGSATEGAVLLGIPVAAAFIGYAAIAAFGRSVFTLGAIAFWIAFLSAGVWAIKNKKF